MSQEQLKEYQKKLFEYDYTIKKIDSILMSGELSRDEREHYQLNKEACQKIKNDCSLEMSDYARKNRLSLLVAPLSKEEKDEIIRSIEEKPKEGKPLELIKFNDLREEAEYEEFIQDVPDEDIKEFSEEEVEYEPDEVEYESDREEDVDEEDLSCDDIAGDNDLSGSPEYSDEEVEFIRTLKETLVAFYG